MGVGLIKPDRISPSVHSFSLLPVVPPNKSLQMPRRFNTSICKRVKIRSQMMQNASNRFTWKAIFLLASPTSNFHCIPTCSLQKPIKYNETNLLFVLALCKLIGSTGVLEFDLVHARHAEYCQQGHELDLKENQTKIQHGSSTVTYENVLREPAYKV